MRLDSVTDGIDMVGAPRERKCCASGGSVRLFSLLRRRLEAIGERGAASIEFAIVGTSFMLMLLAAFEFGYLLFIQSVLDNAARDAARLIRTGQAQVSADPQTTFQTLLCNDVGSLIGCGNVLYQAQVFNDWTSAQTSVNNGVTRDPNTGALESAGFSAGTAGQILVVTVTYNYPFFTPWIGGLVGNGTNSAFLQSTVVFQNEPY
jgi:Flp pilus assembly protein TadG